MRKIIALILCLVFVLSLSGCALVKKNVSWETIEVEVDDPDASSEISDSSEDISTDEENESSKDESSEPEEHPADALRQFPHPRRTRHHRRLPELRHGFLHLRPLPAGR